MASRDRKVSRLLRGFEGMRYGCFADLADHRWRECFDELDRFSHAYLTAAHERGVWPSDYPWPVDALHTNTRLWEYPFVWDVVRRHVAPSSRILDVGSALTFLPPFLARSGHAIVASDVEPRMKTWARELWDGLRDHEVWRGITHDDLDYALADVTRLPFAPDSFDAVTNVSVLEHLPPAAMAQAVEAIARVLKPGGLLICTLDCWLRGEPMVNHTPLDGTALEAYLHTVGRWFRLVEEPTLRHPADLITNRHYPRDVGRPFRPRPQMATGIGSRVRTALDIFRSTAPPLEWCALGMVVVREPGETEAR